MTVTVPDVEGIPFRNVLIIDNVREEVVDLETDLKEKGLSVVFENNSTKAKNLLKERPEINLIVLDWFLNEQDPIESKLILKEIKNCAFAPVIVYSKQGLTEPRLFIKEIGLERIACVLDKNIVDCDLIFDEMVKWIATNPELKVFLKWSFEVEKCLNSVLWTIYDLEAGGLKALVEIMEQPEDASHVPREYDIINLFGKVLIRKLNSPDFFASISDHINKLMACDPIHSDDLEKLKVFHRFERYKDPMGSLWTGDILKSKNGEYQIIVTPICDLCNPGKTENVLLLMAEPFRTHREERKLNKNKAQAIIENKKDSFHYLPYAANLPDGLLCRFDNISSIKLAKLKEMIKGEELRCVETIDSPFIENLIQRMNAYLMRLGVRDIGDKEIKKILDDTPPSE